MPIIRIIAAGAMAMAWSYGLSWAAAKACKQVWDPTPKPADQD